MPDILYVNTKKIFFFFSSSSNNTECKCIWILNATREKMLQRDSKCLYFVF